MSVTKEAFEDAVGVWGKALDLDLDNLKAMATKAKEVRTSHTNEPLVCDHPYCKKGRSITGGFSLK